MDTYEINKLDEVKIYLDGSQEYHIHRDEDNYRVGYINERILSDRRVCDDEFEDICKKRFGDYIKSIVDAENAYESIMVTGLIAGKWVVMYEKGAA